MKILLAVVADAANVERSGKFNIMGMYRTIRSPKMPFNYPRTTVAITLQAEPDEIGKKRKLKIALANPHGRETWHVPGEMELMLASLSPALEKKRGEGTLLQEEMPVFHAIINIVGMEFATEGLHHLQILIDGVKAEEIPLLVERLPERQNPNGTGGRPQTADRK